MQIRIAELSLVVLIGPSGSGKANFASKYFLPTEIVSSATCRGMDSDDGNDQSVTKEVFDLVRTIIRKRLSLGRLTVVDATNVQRVARKPIVFIARQQHCMPVAVVLNLPEKICKARYQQREDRNFGLHAIRQQRSQLRRSLKGLKREGFRHIFTIRDDLEKDFKVHKRRTAHNNLLISIKC